MYTQQRSKIYTDIVPITATMAQSLSFTSEEYADFESYAYGGAIVEVVVGNKSKITSTPDVKTYVSFDEGATWVLADSTALSNTSAHTGIDVVLAPRVKVTFATGSGESLASGHGIKIHTQLEEAPILNGERNFGLTEGLAWADGAAATVYGDVVTCENMPGKVYFGAYVKDVTEVTVAGGSDTVKAYLQTSLDGVNFFDVDSTGLTVQDASTAADTYNFSSFDETKIFGKYFRVRVTSTGILSKVTTDAGLGVVILAVK